MDLDKNDANYLLKNRKSHVSASEKRGHKNYKENCDHIQTIVEAKLRNKFEIEIEDPKINRNHDGKRN